LGALGDSVWFVLVKFVIEKKTHNHSLGTGLVARPVQKKNLPRAHASPLIDFFIRCLYLGPSNDNGCEDLHVFAHALVFALAHRHLNVDTLRHDNIDALQQCYAHGTAYE
jgi:hypothetical protein